MQAIAKLQGKTITEFLWAELISIMERNYGKGTLTQFINEGELINPPSVDEGLEQQRMKFMKIPLESLEEYEKRLMKHIKIFKTELRGKKNE